MLVGWTKKDVIRDPILIRKIYPAKIQKLDHKIYPAKILKQNLSS